MLQINNLIYSYNEDKNVLDGVSFKIKKGKIYCLLGVNGAGKTTLFKCLSGFYKSNIKIDKDVLNKEILYIQDEMTFYKGLTGNEFVRLILDLKNIGLDETIYNKLLRNLKLTEYIDCLISTYSLGSKQKLVLIIGFLLNYNYILMDEPFSSLDFISAEVISNFMREYVNDHCAIIVSTHLIDIAQEIADIILFLNDGKIYEVENKFKTSNEIKKWIKSLI